MCFNLKFQILLALDLIYSYSDKAKLIIHIHAHVLKFNKFIIILYIFLNLKFY